MPSFWGDLVGTIEQFVIGNPAGVSNPSGPAVQAATSAPGVGALVAFEGAWAQLTDGKFWRSLGWILLGVVLMLLGAAILARQSAQSVATGLARGVI